MRIALLGPFEVTDDNGNRCPVAGARLRGLIARLALAGGRPVSTSTLAEAVWGENPPADLPNALQTLVSRARRALGGATAIEQSAAGYRLAITPDDVDALRFERLAAAGSGEEALALWRGPALEDVGAFAASHAQRLAGLRLDTLARWIAAELDAGRAAAHVAALETLAVENPLDEKIAALLMRALAAIGQQAQALAAYERLRSRLTEELGIDPGRATQAMHLEVLRGTAAETAPPAAPPRRRTNLRAQLTSFVGRDNEVDQVGKALTSYRLITLVGPGGAGKTRLATEAAARVAAASDNDGTGGADEIAPDGVWMAELASVTDAADVPQAVLSASGLREARAMLDGPHLDAQTRLLDGLADARALLALDNCEHLVDACAHLADALLAHCPGLRILATSREPLGIVGESLLPVPPLETDPAVRLFADRAKAVSPGFELDSETRPLVAGIVGRLDGLPLAIELAAARLRTLPLAEISRRLDDRFRLLTGGSRTALPRHRTLRAVVEWSWDLLTPAERLLAERFSVFPAGATQEAVAEVCGDGDTDELLASLTDKSLLQLTDGGTRLRMLETIREYGAEKLAERDESDAVRRRHAEYFSRLMNDAAPRLLTRDQIRWLRAVEADRDNILAALRYWCEVSDADRAITLAVSVASLAFLLGNYADIAEPVTQATMITGTADPGLTALAGMLYMVSRTALPHGGEHGPPPDPGLAAQVDAMDLGTHPMAGLLRLLFAVFTQDDGRMDRYIAQARESGNEWVGAVSWLMSAGFAGNKGDVTTFRADTAEALRRFRAAGERWGLAGALRMTAYVQVLDGDLDGARDTYAEANQVLEEMGSRDDESHRPMQLADVAARSGDLDQARELYQAAVATAGSDPWGMDSAIVAAAYALFEATTGNAAAARAAHRSAEQSMAGIWADSPARHHLTATVAAAGLMVSLADGDLLQAGDRAAVAYQSAVEAEDMPLVASVAGPLARLAFELGQAERAAEMLGARAAVRGIEDRTELTVTTLKPVIQDALGPEACARAYDKGKNLSRAEALALLDPATL